MKFEIEQSNFKNSNHHERIGFASDSITYATVALIKSGIDEASLSILNSQIQLISSHLLNLVVLSVIPKEGGKNQQIISSIKETIDECIKQFIETADELYKASIKKSESCNEKD